MPSPTNTGIRAIVSELRGIRLCLESMWHSRYQNGETDVLDPRAYADEYIPLEEAARRLHISEQTIRNWITMGRKCKTGWKEGIHYVNINADSVHRGTIRIPWNQLVGTFAANSDTSDFAFRNHRSYKCPPRPDDLADPDL